MSFIWNNNNNTTATILSDNVCRTSSATAFIVTSSYEKWLPTATLFTILYIVLYYTVQIKASNRQLAIFSLALSGFGVIPFLAYLITGIAWTGMELSDLHRVMIDQRHAVLMFLWLILSVVQLVSYLFKVQKVHNELGKWIKNILLPAIFLELGLNAAFVFVPEKPDFTARAVKAARTGMEPTEESSILDIISFMCTGSMALLTPVTMMMYWWLSKKSLAAAVDGKNKARNIRLHVTYMVLFIYTTISAGVLRWLMKKEYKSSNCEPHTDKAVSALIQTIAHGWTAFYYCGIFTGIYATIPLDLRRNNVDVKASFFWYLITAAFVGPLACYLLEVPSGIQCVQEVVVQETSIFQNYFPSWQ